MDPYLSRIPGGDAEYLQTLPKAERETVDPPIGDGLFGKEGMTFHDVLNIINPLQQLPIVGTIYREITGDEIKPGSRLIGGLLYGGPTGLAAAAVNTVVEYNTGHDIGGEVVAMVRGKPLVTDEARIRVAADKERQETRLANARGESVPAHKAASDVAMAAPTATATDAGTQAAASVNVAANQAATNVAQLPALPAKGGLGIAAGPALTGPGLPSAAAMASGLGGGSPGGAMPSGLADGMAGLTSKSGLPSAGMVTPAAVVAMLGQQQGAPVQRASGVPGVTPSAATFTPVTATANGLVPTAPQTASAQATAEQQAAQNAADAAAPALRMPPRLSMQPRMPAPPKTTGLRTPIVVPSDAVTATSQTASSDAPIILGTPNATPASMTPTGQIPDAMLRALDKYDALIKSRHGGAKMVDQAT